MKNLSIQFSNPWLLLLLIPALAVVLIPYFRLAKKYRRTRNRITPIVLHLLTMLFSILVLAGMVFTYQVPNKENEIILLVDVSDTEDLSQEAREEFIQTVLADSYDNNFKVGIVTFGFDQEYAVPLTYDIDSIYEQYQKSVLPDTSATNIAAALDYTVGLFEHPETAKIVLITDGKETDESANIAIGSVAAQGIMVDTAYISSEYVGNDSQIIGVEMPDYHVDLEDECTISVTIQNKNEGSATIDLYDNGMKTDSKDVDLIAGTQTFTFDKHKFTTQGIHEILFEITSEDLVSQNNKYCSYYYMEVFNKLLILERVSGESTALVSMINAENKYEIETLNVSEDTLPATVDGLREYDQVILNNIAYKDLPEVYDEKSGEQVTYDSLLEEYVRVYGGGVFTVGGTDENGNANAYNRTDLYNTKLQNMLPVQAINYTPPVGVIIIIDRSGSMASADEKGDSKLTQAKQGAAICLDALTERDWVGLMTLDSDYNTILPLTPRTQEAKILNAIDSIDKANGNTIFTGAIKRAVEALRANKNIDKRHIIIVTDGQPADEPEEYESVIEANANDEEMPITLSVVGIGMTEGSAYYTQMERAAVECGKGRVYSVTRMDALAESMKDDLNAPEIEEVNYETFNPIINDTTSPLVKDFLFNDEGGVTRVMPATLDGFFGVKVRSKADLILMGEYEVPIYAQWEYGEGMVGSFMCDLKGDWSADFMADESGQKFILNVINNLMPTENIRPKGITVNLKEDNYTNQLSIDANLEEGQYVSGRVIDLSSGEEITISLNSKPTESKEELRMSIGYVTLPLSAENDYSRCDFVVRQQGVYLLVIDKCAADGSVLETVELYKSFAYSEEYNTFTDETVNLQDSLAQLATRGGGSAIEDLENPWEIFANFITELNKTFDPRIILMILAIVLFLADIAARKFKFKWPHEIYRDIKNKKNK